MQNLLAHTTTEYSGASAPVAWRGRKVNDESAFRKYAITRAAPRLTDAEDDAELRADLDALATTDYATETLRNLLSARVEPQGWELAEALAETFLADEHKVVWPWNHARDKRTPKASLPGKDLIGFVETTTGFALLFGEVKSSSDARTPPQVMYGEDGMVTQLAEAACERSEQFSLLKWLRCRCKDTSLWPAFQQAVSRFLKSSGNDVVIWGVLVRDTEPNEKDLRARSSALASKLPGVSRVELDAWYFPVPIDKWQSLLNGKSRGT
ncbi:MAG TPA: hypothetical protein VEC99_17620 [Clostridia bacterium]|nr:hypothetical protein [Clostridia bacterium]